MREKRTVLTAVMVAVLFCGQGAPAESYTNVISVLTAQSTSDGLGNFTYAFSRGPDPFFLGITNGFGQIVMTFYDLRTASGPPGWVYAWDGASNRVTWTYTNADTCFIDDTPKAFSIKSWITNAVLYDSSEELSFPPGVLAGGVYYTNYVPEFSCGFAKFKYLGPVGGEEFFRLFVSDLNLNPNTFNIQLTTYCQPNRIYGIQSCEGSHPGTSAVWTTIGDYQNSGSANSLTFSDLSGPLVMSGRTYRGVVAPYEGAPIESCVLSVNEVFIGYPFLVNPRVKVAPVSLDGGELTVKYEEGIYTNSRTMTIPGNERTGFFRLHSPDNDPKNAVVQRADSLVGVWTNVP